MDSSRLERDADQAAAEICATLKQFVSPQLGTSVPRADGIIHERDNVMMESMRKSNRYHDSNLEGPDAWENDEDDEYFYGMDATTTPKSGPVADETELLLLGTTSQTKRTKTFHRAGTPVMSNSAKRQDHVMEEDEAEVPYNVQSPWVVRASPREHRDATPLPPAFTSPATPRTPVVIPPSAIRRPLPPSTNVLGADVRPYFQATEHLWLFYRTKQVTSQHQVRDDGNEMSMEEGMTAMEERHVSEQELKVELDFLLSLHRNGWSQMRTAVGEDDFTMLQKEGNFWLLLASLRRLGLASLLWDRDAASQQQHRRLLQSHMQSVTVQTELTPAAILRRWYASPEEAARWETAAIAPLPLQRRQHIVTWLHQCFHNMLPSDVRRARRTKIVVSQGHDPQQETGFFRTDKDEEVLSSCLALLLAGRLSEAQDLVRNSGMSWRAATWGGGAPHGYEFSKTAKPMEPVALEHVPPSEALAEFQPTPSSLVSVGNPHRALWRRMMWKHAEQLAKGRDRPSTYDVAMAALLSSHLTLALDCPALRTWECGLYAVFRCMMDRLEDEVLHQHNEHRRQVRGPVFPGTEMAAAELEHLVATADLADLDEAGAVQILAGTPFDEMRAEDVVTQAMSAFLIGKEAIQSFMQRTLLRVNELSEEELRFVTHVAIYLDMLSFSATTPVIVEGARQWKNELVLLYLDVLVSHEDLWYMLVLYASFLPKSLILDRLPSLLRHVESPNERKLIVQQLSEMLPEQNLDLEVLRGIVGSVLSESEEDDVDNARNLDSPTRLDVRKMESVLWLSLQENHMGEALIAANTLLRQFLPKHWKIRTAIKFTDIVLNDLLSNLVANAEVAMIDSGEPAPAAEMRLQNARSEHIAYLSFLEATKRVDYWTTILKEAKYIHPTTILNDEGIDTSRLNSTELSIAKRTEQRNIIDTKRTTSRIVVTAAEAACLALRKILEHPGGWLLTDDELVATDDIEGIVRHKELDQLHSHILPLIALMYHDVCTGTAAWMSKSLDDAAEALNITAHQAVQEIDDSSSQDQAKSTTKSPVAPRFWTQKALKVADMIENDAHRVRSAFGASDYKSLLSQLAETTVLDSMYRYAEKK